jgi:hypothetical protein
VVFGYLLLIPALAVDVALLAITGYAIYFNVKDTREQQEAAEKQAIAVQDGELRGEVKPVIILPNQDVIFITSWFLTVGWMYVGCPGLIMILVGLLLTMKKKVVRCDKCGALNGEWG